MSRIRTASRLHFGLISLPAEGALWPDRTGRPLLPAARFGGVGMMIESPGVVLRADPAREWSAEGPLAERALAFASSFAQHLEDETRQRLIPQRLVLEQAPREHLGLGVGTQLGLAVARLLAHTSRRELSLGALARSVERGARSALGVHGFEHGGFLVDGGKRDGSSLGPLVARAAFPQAWRVVLVVPGSGAGLHGAREREAFARLSCPSETTDALCRLVLLGMLPALAEEDLRTFGEALFDFNARVGEVFAPVQGGLYANDQVKELVGFIRRQGVCGVGQSSWGPGVFAVTDEEQSAWLADRLREFVREGEAEVRVSRGCNRGAEVEG
jgi:beta-RFAP synthase